MLQDRLISEAIVRSYCEDFINNLLVDVCIVGGGPSGMCAAYYLSKNGLKVLLVEKKLSIGGGVWGGGMLFNKIVVQERCLPILDEFNIKYTHYKDSLFVANAVETVAKLCAKVIDSGTTILNGVVVEDTVVKDSRVSGVVINWTAVEQAKLHVDPLTIEARYVVEATGHDLSVVNKLHKKAKADLNTPTGGLLGERPMYAEQAETEILENTREIYPGLYVTGMAANAAMGSPRMGPIFGGMFLSGKLVAQKILDRIQNEA